MNNLHESLLIASAPAELLVALAIFFCACAVILLALSIEAGNYPGLLGWIARHSERHAEARHDEGPDMFPHTWHAFAGGYEYDRAP